MRFTKDVEKTVAELKELGFTILYKRTSMIEANKRVYVMQRADGVKTEVVGSDLVPSETHIPHIEIRDFDEGLSMHRKNGYTMIKGPLMANTNKAALIKSPDGFMVLLVQHLAM